MLTFFLAALGVALAEDPVLEDPTEPGGGGGPMVFTMAVLPAQGGHTSFGSLWGGRGYGYAADGHLRVGGWGAGGGFNGASDSVGMGLGGVSAEAILRLGPVELPAGAMVGFGGFGADVDQTESAGFMMAVFPTAGAELNILPWLKVGLNATGMYTLGPQPALFGFGTTAHVGFGWFGEPG